MLKDLNPEQKEAVKILKGPVLILAGAGSGKTKTLTHRIAYLLSKGIRPENILAVTFTNKAAQEMKTRIFKLLKNQRIENYKLKIENLFISTFHSLGVKILRKEIQTLGWRENFVIYDEEDTLRLAKDVLKKLNLAAEKFKPTIFLDIVSKAKNELKEPEELEFSNSLYSKKAKDFYAAYQTELKKANALDFDDLIKLPVKIFEKTPKTLKRYQNQFQYILIDEYQDTNFAQWRLVKLLAQKHQNLFIIGDPDQAIYSWRGADFRNILNFEKEYPQAKVIKLEENYRSTQNILSAAHKIISKNVQRKEKTLWTRNPAGTLIEIIQGADEREEADFVISKIVELCQSKIIDLNEAVIMYRTNAQSRVLEEACLAYNLPYQIIGGIKFYQRKEIKDILAFLRLIQNSDDELSQKRITLVLGKKATDKFNQNLNQTKKEVQNLALPRLIKFIIKKIDYYDYLTKKFPARQKSGDLESEERIGNIKELIGLAEKYQGDLQESLVQFLTEVALMQDTEKIDFEARKLNLMTLHSAKGLEFEAVFICGLEEGLLPHAQAVFSQEELEEERRLCYVGITRAKKYLWLSYVTRRSLWGQTNETLPSRFLEELPENLIRLTLPDKGDQLPEIRLE